MALLLRTLESVQRSPSTLSFAQYREAESQNYKQSSVTSDGELLDVLTLELRVHPPNVNIDNDSYDDRTIITVDSANRPGTLVEVVQCLTELALNVKRARISSDGGWFVDEFHVVEASGRKVTNEEKLRVIRAVLNIEYEPESPAGGSGGGAAPAPAGAAAPPPKQPLTGAGGSGCVLDRWAEMRQCSTVFELAGQDRAGLLADVLDLLTHNGCDVLSAAVWTYKSRVAFVVSVAEGGGAPVRDGGKVARLKQLLLQMMDAGGNGLVQASVVKGLIHYERRLHQLMLKEEERGWARVKDRALAAAGIAPAGGAAAGAAGGGGGGADGSAGGWPANGGGEGGEAPRARCQVTAGPEVMCVTSEPPESLAQSPSGGTDGDGAAPLVSPKYSRPQVTIQHYAHMHYWLVTIRCKDRNKLLFDSVCTLSDLNYDVYHAAVDCEGEACVQLYYIRPRFGDFFWDPIKATKLRVMLESAIQRRFPKGLKVHVAQTHQHCLADLTRAWKEAGLWITRAKVRAFGENGHTLYVMDASGTPPDPRKVQQACQLSGGQLQADLTGGLSPPGYSLPPGVKPGGVTPQAHAQAQAQQQQQVAGSVSIPGGGGAAGDGATAKFFYTFLQRTWDGSPSSMTSN
ncbi:MAG: hypothetical protein J3K34DRAFT_523655 [Monoraphidium minutum]|nr:MAG: hypothetical protein J3K34DRAFT_523655 [Monoraphidium minutum]